MSADFGGDSLFEDERHVFGVGAHKLLSLIGKVCFLAVVDFLPCLAHRHVLALSVEEIADLL